MAREIGMSVGGLHVLLSGSEPQRKTLEKLRAWKARQDVAGTLTPAEAGEHLAALLSGAPEALRARLVLAWVDALPAVCREVGAPVPGWIDGLRETLDAG